jgi:translocation and assembly module TamB
MINRSLTLLRTALLALLVCLSVSPAAIAQDANDDGQGFLTRKIQDLLSGAGRQVSISGFTGALSSSARMARLSIADDEGVWLELNNAELDWSRTALLRGRLQVQKLSAESITLYRLPKSDPKSTSPEASGFSIPDLPVAINIDEINIAKFDLKEPVIGQAAVISLTGRAALADGGLDAALDILRQDKDGQVKLSANYDPEQGQLAVDIGVQEPEGGIVASLMNLPGRPSIDMTIAGTGPLDDYKAEMQLDTDGERRLTGTVSLSGRDDGGREFALQVGGDLTPLAAPDYRDFLGTDIGFVATGTRAANGAIDLQLLRLSSAALNIQGKLAMDENAKPASFDLRGTLASPAGEERVDLPFASGVSLASATMNFTYDRSTSNDMSGQIEALSPTSSGFAAEKLVLSLSGPLNETGTSRAVIGFDATGLSATDPAVAQALGDQITGSAAVVFGSGPVRVEDLKVDGKALTLAGSLNFTPNEGQAQFDLAANAKLKDLAAFSSLSGLSLQGQADLDMNLELQLPAGTAKLTATGSGTNIRTGIAQADALLTTPVQLELDVDRGEQGITLNNLILGTEALRLTGQGRLGSKDGAITYNLHLADAGLLTGADAGPVDVSGAISQGADGLRVTAKGGGQDLALGIAPVDALLAGGLDLDVSLLRPTEGPMQLERALIQSDALRLNASGAIDPAAMALDVDARLANSAVFTGGKAGPLTLAGQVRTEEGGVIHAILSGGGANIGTGIAAVDALLNGQTDINADVLVDGGLITIKRAEVTTPGLTTKATGTMQDGDLALDLTASLPNSAAPLGGRAGPLTLSANVTGSNGGYQITANGSGQSIGIGNPQIDALFRGETNLVANVGMAADGTIKINEARLSSTAVSASASGTVANGAPDVSFTARLDNIARLVDGLSGPLSLDGTAKPGPNGATTLNVTADGPAGANARIAGDVLMPNGAVNLTIKGAAPLGLANSFIAPRSVSGPASFDLAMNGQPGLAALNGQISLDNARLVAPTLGQVIDGISGRVTLSGGQANLDLRATPSEGGQITIAGPIGLAAPYRAGLNVALNNVIATQAGLATTRLNGQIEVDGGLTGGGTISGRIGLSDTEVRLSSGGFGGQEAIPDIRHIDEPRASRLTRERAGLIGDDSKSDSGSGSASGGLNLNLLVATDTSVFIRGRGLDAELRGQLQLLGTTSSVEPVGEFDLVRGRLNILTKRLELTDGSVRLAGGFEPIIHFVATSQSGSYTVSIAIDGTAADPEVTFSSNPGLPEDEILSQLFFGRGIDTLSALQAARLAAAVATLTGSGQGGVLDKIRSSTGLDDLDISTTQDGQTSLKAGKYINENVYTETEVTGDGETSLSINLDLSNTVKAKGAVKTDGETSLGIFFEKDY